MSIKIQLPKMLCEGELNYHFKETPGNLFLPLSSLSHLSAKVYM